MTSSHTGARRALALGTTLVATLALAPGTAIAAPAAAPGAAAAVPERYLAQEIDWSPCFPEDEVPEGLPEGSDDLECGVYLTPRDWEAPDSGDLVIAVSRLRPDDADDAEASLLTNPGGPGGPGLYLPLLFLDADRERLLESREIVGFDPRGTGESTNVTCAGATGVATELDARDRSEANTTLILDAAEFTARLCQGAVPELSPVISTEQTVHDIDLLRALLGRESIDWLGYSGGTWMGAAYATYFPDRVGRFVLDANTEFTAPWQATFERQPLGFERRWREDFLPWAARYDDRFGLGATPEEVLGRYEALRAALAAQPLALGGGFEVGPALLDALTAQSMYDKGSFTDLADVLGALSAITAGEAEAAGVQAPALASALRTWSERVADRPDAVAPAALDAFDATFFHITCNDTPWVGDRASLLARSAEQGAAYPLVGPYTLYEPCVFWDRPEQATLAPRTGEGVPPVLMVQTERDPATPVEGALAARQSFAGARLLLVEDEGDHTVYPGNECVDEKVEDFLLGEAEAEDSTCQGEGLPEPGESNLDEILGDPGAAATPVERALAYARAAGR
jgi:pimeloyl-ACP methyl ester carboxylesterase